MSGRTERDHASTNNGISEVSISSVHSQASSPSSRQHIDRPLIRETDGSEENRPIRTTRTIQIVISESWIEGILTHVLWEEARELFVDLLSSVLHLIYMDPDTLLLFSTILLTLDRIIISFVSVILENMMTRTIVQPERRVVLLEKIESLLMGASWGLHVAGKNDDNGDSVESYNNMGNLVCWMPWKLGCSDNFDSSDVFSLTTVVMTALVAVFINTSYFTTLMAPLYSRLLDSHNLSTEVLLGLLLLSFGLETVTALSLILLGYKLLSTHMAGIYLEDNNRGVVPSDTTVHEFSSLGMREEANILLVLATLLWLACVVTSKVVRMAFYHSIGD
jgi:hypothetical protein